MDLLVKLWSPSAGSVNDDFMHIFSNSTSPSTTSPREDPTDDPFEVSSERSRAAIEHRLILHASGFSSSNPPALHAASCTAAEVALKTAFPSSTTEPEPTPEAEAMVAELVAAAESATDGQLRPPEAPLLHHLPVAHAWPLPPHLQPHGQDIW